MRALGLGSLALACGCGLVLDVSLDDGGADAASLDAATTRDGPRTVDGSMLRDGPQADADAADAGPPGCGELLHLATVDIDTAETPTPAPFLVWTGDGFGVVWHGQAEPTLRRVYYARLDADGALVGPPTPVTGTAGNGDYAVLAWNGSELALAWEDSSAGDSAISFMRLSIDGTPIGALAEVSSPTPMGEADRPALAWSGSEYAIAWEDSRDGLYRVYARFVDGTGTPEGAEMPVSPEGIAAREARIAWSGAGFGAAWHQFNGSASEVAATMLTTLDMLAIRDADDPDLVWLGSGWAIGCEFVNDLVVRLSDASFTGSVTMPLVSAMPGDDDEPSLEWTGTELGIAFEAVNAGQTDVHFVAVDESGSVVRPVRVIDDLPGVSQTPTLAWADGRYGVVWAESIPGDTTGRAREIYFAWICP